MLRAFTSEWLKIRRRSVLAGGAAMIVLTVLGLYLGLTRIHSRHDAFGVILRVQSTDGLVYLLSRGADFVAVVALVTVGAAIASEWSQGTLRNLLVQQPARVRLLGGRLAALLLYVLVAAALAMLVGIAVAVNVAPGQGIDTSAWGTSEGLVQVRSFLLDLGFAIIGWSLFGTFIAVLARSAVAAVGVSIGWLLVVEHLLLSVWPDVGQWLPGNVLQAVLDGGNAAVAYSTALLVAVLYMAAFAAGAAVLFRARDVTA